MKIDPSGPVEVDICRKLLNGVQGAKRKRTLVAFQVGQSIERETSVLLLMVQKSGDHHLGCIRPCK